MIVLCLLDLNVPEKRSVCDVMIHELTYKFVKNFIGAQYTIPIINSQSLAAKNAINDKFLTPLHHIMSVKFTWSIHVRNNVDTDQPVKLHLTTR